MYFKYLNQSYLSETYVYMAENREFQITSGTIHHSVPLTEVEFEGYSSAAETLGISWELLQGRQKLLKPKNRSSPCLQLKEEGLRKI